MGYSTSGMRIEVKKVIGSMYRYVALAFFLPAGAIASAQVAVHPGDNVPRIVASKPAGTTFIFAPGTYRLAQPIVPKDNDKFMGETACNPPANSCPAIISGSILIGATAKLEGGNYAVHNQSQHNPRGTTPKICDDGWLACIDPEDLFFDGQPYRHLDSPTLPTIGPGEWWFDYTNHVIYFHDDPAGHTVETSVVNNAFGGPANNITVEYLTVEEFANMYPVGAIGAAHGANGLSQGTNWTVNHCEVKLNHGTGVRIGYRMHILNNYIHDNGQLGVGGGLGTPANPETESTNSGILIEGNTINHNDYAHFNPGWGAGGTKFGATSGIILRRNVIEHNEGSGIHFDIDCQNELVDGNVLIDNSDGDGLEQEIGEGTSVFRNNLLLRNGAHVNTNNWAYQVAVRASTGVEIYCNVMEVPPAEAGIGAWGIGASPRGSSEYPPFGYHVTTGNYVHHNTIIFDAGANGGAGFIFNDPAHQPNFFADNPPPDYNDYHVPNPSAPRFIYDNNNSRANRAKKFREHQASRADIHGTIDANYTSGFPVVSITSPADETTVSGPVAISATASDNSGIQKVEFYVDWKLSATSTSSPYSFDWTDPASGSHIVAAMAYSHAGIRTCYAVTLNAQ